MLEPAAFTMIQRTEHTEIGYLMEFGILNQRRRVILVGGILSRRNRRLSTRQQEIGTRGFLTSCPLIGGVTGGVSYYGIRLRFEIY